MDEPAAPATGVEPDALPPPPIRSIVAAVLVVLAAVLPAFLTGAVAVQQRADLGFSAAALGVSIGFFFLTAALSSALLGRVSERMGSTWSLRLAAWSSGAVQLAIAVGADTWAILTAMLAIGGIANALAQPAANLLVARAIPEQRLGLAFSLKQSGVPAATLLGGLAVPSLALTVGWRWAYAAGAALAVLASVVVPRVPRAARAGLPERDAPMAPLVVLGVAIAFGAAAAGALVTFLVSAGVDAGLSDGAAALLLTVGSAIGIAARIVMGQRADRLGGGHLRAVAAMLVGGAAAFGLIATGVPWIMVAATPLAFGAGWAWPGLFNLSIVRNNPNAPAAATGITQTGTYIGACIGPLAFGIIVDRSSYGLAWMVAAGWAVAGAVATVAGRRLLLRTRAAGSGGRASR